MQAYVHDNYEYKALRTADGSPSLLMGEKQAFEMQAPEAMHNSAGALTESFYIYYENIRSAQEHHLRPSYLSVGLGLGYNEAIIACHALKENLNPLKLSILSFERDAFIRENYVNWLLQDAKKQKTKKEGSEQNKAEDFWGPIFTEVLQVVAKHMKMDWKSAKHLLKSMYNEGSFKIENDMLTYDWAGNKRKFTSILFDAFSKKSTPDVWSEEFITRFLQSAADEKCILTTYAATGSLNRALRNNHFTLVDRKGFQGKRESTWAERLELHDKTFL
ncbi:MAG: MnmC family methyltransferase [Bdellovibrionota bacterium]|mgnify:FL=1